MKMKLLSVAALLAAGAVAMPAVAGVTLDNVKKRGHVLCGVNTSAPGFSSADSQGKWRGLDVNICRSVAAAVLGDADKVKYVPLSSPQRFTALQSGEIDIAQIGHGAHSLCIQGEAKIFAFDQLSKADAVVANKAKGIEKAADLKGKTVGVAAGTSSEIILQYVLEDAGLTKDDVTLTEMDVSGMTTALISGQIDAAATWSPATVTLEQELGDDYLVLGTNVDYSDKVAFPGSYICAVDYAEKNSEILARFGAAIIKAHIYRAEHTEDLAKMLAKELELPEDTLVASVGEGDWEGAVEADKDVETVKGYYEAQQKVFLDGGAIDAEVPVEDYVLVDVMTDAQKVYADIK